jgi:nucleoside-diphosphate-sugar epimerase
MSFSPYGVLKNVGELYTKSLSGLIVKFWNVYGIEQDMEKAHVITDFIRKGFEEKEFRMLTNGLEEREFLYAEDCCEALEKIMINYEEFNSNDDLHITSFNSTTILEIASIIENLFRKEGLSVKIKPGVEKDQVQRSKKNKPNQYITKWWSPRTSIREGIGYVFDYMKGNY